MNLFSSVYSRINKKEKNKFSLIFVMTVLILLLEFFSLALFLPLINLIFNDSFYFSFINIEIFDNWTKIQQISFCLLIIVSIFVIKNFFFGFLIYFKKKFLADIEVDFTSRAFKSYLDQSYSFHLKGDKSGVMRNLGIVSEYVVVLDNLFNLLLEFLILLVILSIIFYQDYQVGIFISIISFLFIIIISGTLKKRLKKYGELRNIFDRVLLNSYLDTFSSIKDVILQKKQDFFLKDYKKNLAKLARLNVKTSFVTELPRLFVEVTIVICISFLIYFLFLKSQDTTQTLINLTFITALMFRATPSVSRINFQLNSLSYKIDIIKRTNDLIDQFTENKKILNESKNLKVDKNFELESLKLENISFNYERDQNNLVFKNLNLEIKKNQTIGIIGSSGSGKSTLIDLMTCILKPNNGSILINNNKIDQNIIDTWQSKIACISQKNYLLNSTIKNNVAFGEDEQDIDYKKIKESLELAKIHYLVEQNEDGLDFYIGEDGKNISGGQRQRLVIARALYRNSDVLIFDEATSALDKQVEREIFDDIKKNFYGSKTLIISTHNHDLLNFCDIVFDINKLKKN